MGKPRLLVVEIGTFCDFQWMDTALYGLSERYDLHILTNEGRVVPSWVKGVYTVKTPAWVLKDIDHMPFKSDTDLKYTMTMDAYKHAEGYNWYSRLGALIQSVYEELNPVGFVVHYGIIGTLMWIPPEALRIPIIVLYYCPAFVNTTTPYPFDSILKNTSFDLYSNTKQYHTLVANSWKRWEYFYTLIGWNSFSALKSFLSKLEHVVCYDSHITPPVTPLYKSFKVHHLGSIYADAKLESKRWYSPDHGRSPPESLARFLKQRRPILTMSFGSYLMSYQLLKILPFLVEATVGCGYAIVFHASVGAADVAKLRPLVETSPYVHLHPGWLPYEWIVPKSNKIMFTGSICLQTVCLYNQTPMIFVPMLAEQFFWARNYEFMTRYEKPLTKSATPVQTTGVPFVNYNDSESVQLSNLVRALLGEFPGVPLYLKSVGESMRKRDGKQELAQLVHSLCG